LKKNTGFRTRIHLIPLGELRYVNRSTKIWLTSVYSRGHLPKDIWFVRGLCRWLVSPHSASFIWVPSGLWASARMPLFN